MLYRDMEQEITAADLAKLLAISERHAAALLKDRLIAGRQLRSGAWLTSRAAAARYLAIARRGGGRSLNAATAWGMLWELSGSRPTWLSTSTLARVRQQILALTPEEIVRETSGRTRAHYFSRSSSLEISSDALIRTGRPVARRLKVNVAGRREFASGYVRVGTIAEFAARWGMTENYAGRHVLFENTLPISYSHTSMPDAVIAVDLVASGNDYERKRGLVAVARLQAAWRAAH